MELKVEAYKLPCNIELLTEVKLRDTVHATHIPEAFIAFFQCETNQIGSENSIPDFVGALKNHQKTYASVTFAAAV